MKVQMLKTTITITIRIKND